MIKIVPANRQHIESLYKELPGPSLRAVAVLDGDRVIGVGGTFLLAGVRIVFANMTDELRHQHKRSLVKAYRAVKEMFGEKVFAQCDHRIPKAAEFLTHLGFEKVNEDFYVWTR